jgi:hypothetical protein
MPKFHGTPIDLGRRDTLKFLKTCEYRERAPDPADQLFDYDDGDLFEVLYNGDWLEFCRCDLHREVCSAYQGLSPQEYLIDEEDSIIGAWIENGKFKVIDSLTDG